MHEKDWLHGDVDFRNILLVDGKGVLSDLELARRSSVKDFNDVVTGSLWFVPLEYYNGSVLKSDVAFKRAPIHGAFFVWEINSFANHRHT